MSHTLPEKLTAEMLQEGMVLLLDKPKGWSSFDVVNKMVWAMKRQFKVRIKVGHAGTLDPEATGLLILCTGKFTKRIDEFQGMEKIYTGTFIIGATTPSYDMETEPDAHFPIEHITEEYIKESAKAFTGVLQQFPPAFSAVKIKGERAYEIARRGEVPDIKAKEITVSEFNITDVRIPKIWFEINCSKGTYIRSLVHDLGSKMGCGAYLETLRRTKIGQYSVNDAIGTEAFIAKLC